MSGSKAAKELPANDAMLPAYIQYGVHSPEAAVASLIGVPRQFAEPFGQEYREKQGELKPENAGQFKAFIEGADLESWRRVVSRSTLSNLDANDVRYVFRQMQGLS